ncbi:alanine:cation symporter family protein [Polaromonas sp. CG_9.11]|uniref:alanine:cation symporter family protein n=1 Tax=Polaromonas sp. CG_9.11 TaxID=2787730 RepID=UPI001A269994|nr:alanine:cation symporter family protein [Polaromonas sp. CG_9.11]MBG6074561.1 AGCS family alanine or glycine:cation symporter [Polaromonas sp. CG_9.11]
MPYRAFRTLFVMVDSVTHLDFVWLLANALNACMAFPNLVSLVLLSPVVRKVTTDYFAGKAQSVPVRYKMAASK